MPYPVIYGGGGDRRLSLMVCVRRASHCVPMTAQEMEARTADVGVISHQTPESRRRGLSRLLYMRLH